MGVLRSGVTVCVANINGVVVGVVGRGVEVVVTGGVVVAVIKGVVVAVITYGVVVSVVSVALDPVEKQHLSKSKVVHACGFLHKMY